MFRALTRSKRALCYAGAATLAMGLAAGFRGARAEDTDPSKAPVRRGIAPQTPPTGTPFLVDPVAWTNEFLENRIDDVKWMFRTRFTEEGRREREEILKIKGNIRPDIRLNDHYRRVYSDEFNDFELLSQDVPQFDYTPLLLSNNRPEIYLDVTIGDGKPQRLVFRLYGDVQPQAAKEFLAAADGFIRRNIYYSFRHTFFHRVVADVSVHGGDLTARDGTGGTTVAGAPYKPDGKVRLRHDQPFLLSLDAPRRGKYTSRFLVTLKPAPELDDDHVVIGELVSGHEFLREMSKVPVDEFFKPQVNITIVDCGIKTFSSKPKPDPAASADKPAAESKA